MEFVMRYLFWIVLLVIVALAGGFWFLTVPGLEEQTAKLQSEIDSKSAELKNLANKKDEIKTGGHVQAAKAYEAKLKAEEQAVKAMLRSKSTTVDPRFEQAPADPLRFDEWLIGIRKEILGQAEKAGLVLPPGFAQTWLDEGRITTKPDREPRLKKVAFIGEVVRLLCEAKASVPVVEFASKPDQQEAIKQVPVGVCSLDGLELLDAGKREARVKDYMTQAFASTAKSPPALKALPAQPCKADLLDIRFTAPLAVVPAVVQAFETGPRWFGEVTKIDCQRATEPYSKTPVPAKTEMVTVGSDGKAVYNNTHYQEGPVQVQIWVELLSFDENALK